MRGKAIAYQPIANSIQTIKYSIDIHLNEWQILTVSVVDSIGDTEWKQEFTQKHFPTNNINNVTKILLDAIKPANMKKRCKIIADENWLYLTVDNGTVLPSLRLPNIENAMPPDEFERKQTGVSPRHYVTGGQLPGESSEILHPIPQNNVINIVDESSDDCNEQNDESDDLFQNMKPIETQDNNHNKYEPETKQESNDIIRIFAWFAHVTFIIITLFLAGICYIYGVAQLHSIKMSNLFCDDNKTLEEIREYNAINNNPLGEEYSCYQIHGNFIDYKTLFDANVPVAYESTMEYDEINFAFGIVFGIFCIVFVCVVLFDVGYIIWFICKQEEDRECYCFDTCKCYAFCVRWFSMDMKGWVIGICILETIQIVIQSILLLNYGGIDIFIWNWNSSSDIFIQLPWVIICYAVIILCYGILVSVLWSLYSTIPKVMFGFRFTIGLFVIDWIFNFLFAVFPFIIHKDHIDENIFNSSIGVLRINTIQFVATIYPLILLIFTCYIALKYTHYISYIGFIDNDNINTMERVRKQSVANSMHTANRHSQKLKYDLDPLFIKVHFDNMEQFNIDRDEQKELQKQDKYCKICLIIFALLLLAVTCLISISVILDIQSSKTFCNEYNNINHKNPELMVYNDVCKIKVHKLFDNEYSCNCQLVVLDNEYLTDFNSTICQIHEKHIGNITGIDILNNIFMKWNMINRLFLDQEKSIADEIIYGCIESYDNSSVFSFTNKQMFSSQYMELIYIRNLHIDAISSEIASHWRRAQLIAIPDTILDADDVPFQAISSLPLLKSLQLKNIYGLSSRNSEHMLSLCNLNNTLESLQIDNSFFEGVDDCFVDFKHLKYLLLNYDGINRINWDILNVTTLKRLSLYASTLPFESLNDQFISSNVYKNNENLTYVFLGGDTPICGAYEQFNSQSAIEFINTFDACEEGCSTECAIYNQGDGFCHPECNTNNTICDFDSGDCSQ